MLKFHKFVATVCGIGYIGKGAGTIAAVAYCIIHLLMPAGIYTGYRQVLLTLLISSAGVWSGNVVDKFWGKDSNKVVIDEFAGVMITLMFIPVTIGYVLTGLILFRFFDILKPLFIRKMELLPRGWGVMADDVLAGIYAHIILKVIADFKLFN